MHQICEFSAGITRVYLAHITLHVGMRLAFGYITLHRGGGGTLPYTVLHSLTFEYILFHLNTFLYI